MVLDPTYIAGSSIKGVIKKSLRQKEIILPHAISSYSVICRNNKGNVRIIYSRSRTVNSKRITIHFTDDMMIAKWCDLEVGFVISPDAEIYRPIRKKRN